MQKFTKVIAVIVLITAMFVFIGCNKQGDGDVRVTTYTPQDITQTSAKCGGDVIVTQGLSLNELGVCWSTERNPTASDTHLSTTNWSDTYVCTITGLEPSTKYHVRAYALRGLEYYYGEDKSFTTEENGGGGGGGGSTNDSFTVSVSASPSNGGTVTGGGTFQQGQSCTVTATPDSGYAFSKWTENGNEVSTDASYSFTVTGNRTLVAIFTLSGGSYNGHDYVDLGLPSGLLWATCNVGADNPEDYGDYFAWGETTTKSKYTWSTYQYANGTSWQDPQLTKYCTDAEYGNNGFVDNLTTLQLGDDAARANWGGDWRMPTKAEWEELLSNATVTWTTQNGVNGILFTAANGNSLFLPAAGYCYLSSALFGTGSYGNYWSSSLYTDYPYLAWYFNFTSDHYYYGYRAYGQSVRAVRSSAQN